MATDQPRSAPADRRPITTPHFALNELRRLILSGSLAPGQPIRQESIAELLGISRVPIREALKILEGEGQVVYRPRRGYVVNELSVEDLSEVYRLRQLLETEAARKAVKKLTDAQLDELEQAEADFESAGPDILDLATANRRFHFMIFEAAGMPQLIVLLTRLWDASAAYRVVGYDSQQHRRRVEREHWSIIEALRARDSRRVVRMLNLHRDASIESLRRSITSLKAPGGSQH